MRLFENIGSGDLLLLNSEEINHVLTISERYDHHCFLLEYIYHSEYYDLSYNIYINLIKNKIDRIYTESERELYSAIIAAATHHDSNYREFIISELENIYKRRPDFYAKSTNF